MAEDGEGLGSVADPDAAVVRAEGDVEDPLEAILDAPMAPDGGAERRGVSRKAGEIVAGLDRDGLADAASGLDADDAPQVRPGAAAIEITINVQKTSM